MKIPEYTCRVCGYKADHSTSVDDNSNPRPGDVSVCLNCGAISIFDKQFHQHPPTEEQKKALYSDPEFVKTMEAIDRALDQAKIPDLTKNQ